MSESLDQIQISHLPTGAAEGDGPGVEELDRLYRQALEAVDSMEASLESAARVEDVEIAPTDVADADVNPPEAGASEDGASAGVEQAAVAADVVRRLERCPAFLEKPGFSRVTPQQVIEAALFVGGTELTLRRLCRMFQDEFDAEFVSRAIDELNEKYAAQGRPYEVRFGEGGYRLALKSEFEKVRHRVFGVGPKEVRLSQEALEVLSLIAYRQPISPEEIEQAGKTNSGGTVRQLIRRKLVAVERDESAPKQVRYTTTDRFLQLFGLGDLDELPRAEELSFK